jgi:tetratricopeptide (TPR) repeat protein
MAPEQFQARWRDFGPWTDLYALGCIACQLATGRTPFSGDAMRLAIAHCHDVPEAPQPSADGYPAGFAAWVLRLLEKEPGRRFASAADAAWGLLQLTRDEPPLVAGWEGALRARRPFTADDGPVEDSLAPPLENGIERTRRLRGSDGAALDASLDPAQRADTIEARPRRAGGAPSRASHEEGGTRTEDVHASTAGGSSSAAPFSEPSDPSTKAAAMRTHVFARVHTDPSLRSAPAPALVHAAPSVGDVDERSMATSGTRHILHWQPSIDAPGRAADEAPRGEPSLATHMPWTDLLAMPPRDDGRGGAQEGVVTETYRGAVPVRGRQSAPRLERLLAPRAPPPMPKTWRRPGPVPSASRHLLGAGLGLYGLRQIPLVDRDRERDVIWDALSRVHGGDGVRVVVVRGPAGIGKTRLVEWLVERAAEVGAAHVVRAGHGPGGGPLDGLAGLVALHTRAVGLKGGALVERLQQVGRSLGVADREEALAWSAVVEPNVDAASERGADPRAERGADRVALGSARERHAAVLRYLRGLAADRPVIAWLDDVQWGPDALAFAALALEDHVAPDARLLVMLSATEEVLGERPAEAAALDALARRPRTIELRLPHLPEADHQALVQELLGLEPTFAAMVAQRTAGNPLFAVTLVGDFVARGLLEVTPAGFAPKRGTRALFPDDLHAMWSGRLERELLRLPASARLALELGAVLGAHGDDGEWQALCEEAGVVLPPALTDALTRARLVVVDPAGARFSHAMLRESLLRTAAEHGRLEGHHEASARMLLRRYPERRRGIAERVGRHLVAAGSSEAALPHLLAAAAEAARSSGAIEAHALLDEHRAVMDRMRLPDGDVRRARAAGLRASVLAEQGRSAEAGEVVAEILRFIPSDPTTDAAAEAAWESVRTVALRVGAQIALGRGRYEEAAPRFHDAIHAAKRAREHAELVQSLAGLADCHYYRGHLQESGEILVEAVEVCEREGDDAGLAFCLWNAAYCAVWQGELEQARALLGRQQELARRAGHRAMIGSGRNALGDVERLSGSPETAEARYGEALRIFEAVGSAKHRVVRVNLTLNAVARGNVHAAQRMAAALLPELERTGERVLVSLCEGALAVAAAYDARWSDFDRRLDALRAPHLETGLVNGEHAVLFEAIGDHARLRGDEDRAVVCYEAAIELWQALGREDRADAVTKTLDDLVPLLSLEHRSG